MNRLLDVVAWPLALMEHAGWILLVVLVLVSPEEEQLAAWLPIFTLIVCICVVVAGLLVLRIWKNRRK